MHAIVCPKCWGDKIYQPTGVEEIYRCPTCLGNGAVTLTPQQLGILTHTRDRAPRGCYCGGGTDMDRLVQLGLMRSRGTVSFVPDEYFGLTDAGSEILRLLEASPTPA